MTTHVEAERPLIMHDSLMQRIAALKCWMGPITCTPLVGGITNHSFIVTSEQGRFVARVCEERRYLGIDRTNEWLCQLAAHKAGVTVDVLCFADGYPRCGIPLTGVAGGRGTVSFRGGNGCGRARRLAGRGS